MADKSQADIGVAGKSKRSWPLWKKLLVGGVVLLAIIALAVGLGVGLTRGKSGGEDEGDNDEGDNDEGNNGQDDQPDEPGNQSGNQPNQTGLWQPKVGASWQIALLHPLDLDNKDDINPDVEIYDLDLYDNDADTFSTLRKAGKKVICYFSAGSWENWRDDKDDFADADLGKELDGWPGEKWLNVSSPNVHNIMKKRIKLASEKGCNAIDPDNVDGFVSSPLKLLYWK